MDVGHTYVSLARVRVMVYAEPQFQVPATITLTTDGMPVEFFLLAERPLHCGRVDGIAGSCEDRDCHRMTPGKCLCGRHDAVTITKAAR